MIQKPVAQVELSLADGYLVLWYAKKEYTNNNEKILSTICYSAQFANLVASKALQLNQGLSEGKVLGKVCLQYFTKV